MVMLILCLCLIYLDYKKWSYIKMLIYKIDKSDRSILKVSVLIKFIKY